MGGAGWRGSWRSSPFDFPDSSAYCATIHVCGIGFTVPLHEQLRSDEADTEFVVIPTAAAPVALVLIDIGRRGVALDGLARGHPDHAPARSRSGRVRQSRG